MSEKTREIEENEVFAERVPPGDRWKLVSDPVSTIHPTIMDALEAYYLDTKFTGDFRLSPRGGKLYAIKAREEVIPKKPEKKYNIYGDPT